MITTTSETITTAPALTTLRNCLDAAREAIVSGEIDHAIDVCFHILCSYPKSIETHCLLGEAYREKGLVDEAEDTFKRVLSADPENLIARWALSILEEDKGNIESALWNLQLAFELNPGHSELRYELARLSEESVFLTRGALGRIYARGELFDRALTEFRSILSVQPRRLDILVALSETLWRCGQYGDARTVCERALEDSPDCLKPNIILGHILSSDGDKDRAQAHLDRAVALDPENVVASQLLDGTDIPALLPKVEVKLPQFEEITSDWGTNHPPTREFDATEDSIFDDFDSLEADQQGTAYTEPEISNENSEALNLEVFNLSEEDTVGGENEQDFSTATVLDAGATESIEPESLEPETLELETLELETPEPETPELETSEPETPELRDEFGAERPEEPEEYVEDQVQLPDEMPDLSEQSELQPILTTESEIEEVSEVGEAIDDRSPKPAVSFTDIAPQKAPVDLQDYQSHLELAEAYEREGKLEQAVKEYELIIKSSPEMVDQVIEGLKSLLRSNRNLTAANRALGDAYMKIGKFQQAIDCYNKCLKK